MKRMLLFWFFFITTFICYAQIEMPDKMKQSVIQLRPGVLDLEYKTVEQIFLNKEFIINEQLDGSIATVKYGKTELSGNEYSLDIDFYNGTNKNATLTFVFVFQGESTLLEKIVVNNYQTSEYEESSEFSDKYQLLILFNNLIKKE